ncbi:hypothetical protein C2E31_23275, partial [Rhodopirellula baltica]
MSGPWSWELLGEFLLCITANSRLGNFALGLQMLFFSWQKDLPNILAHSLSVALFRKRHFDSCGSWIGRGALRRQRAITAAIGQDGFQDR